MASISVGWVTLVAHDYFQSIPATPVGSVFYPENALIERFDNVKSVEVRSISETAQYVVLAIDGSRHYVNAQTGERWQTSAPLAAKLARQSYNGPGSVKEVQAVTGSEEIIDWNKPGYRVTFTDETRTRVYVDAGSGEVVDHRNNSWWLSDWMFPLYGLQWRARL